MRVTSIPDLGMKHGVLNVCMYVCVCLRAVFNSPIEVLYSGAVQFALFTSPDAQICTFWQALLG